MTNAAPYWLIEDSRGYLLRDGGSGVSRSSLADDAALWSRQGNHSQAVGGHTPLISDTPPETAPETLRTLGQDGRQTEQYRDAGMELRLSSRVAADVERLCNALPTTAPPGAPPVLVIERQRPA